MTPSRSARAADLLPAYSTCMGACEACMLACTAVLRGQPGPAPLPVLDATVCVQACELALHAMASGAIIVPSACNACARCCESLARDCMLLGGPGYARCAQACYRAARECHRVAEAGRVPAQAAPRLSHVAALEGA